MLYLSNIELDWQLRLNSAHVGTPLSNIELDWQLRLNSPHVGTRRRLVRHAVFSFVYVNRQHFVCTLASRRVAIGDSFPTL
jgi:hypothetical protein